MVGRGLVNYDWEKTKVEVCAYNASLKHRLNE